MNKTVQAQPAMFDETSVYLGIWGRSPLNADVLPSDYVLPETGSLLLFGDAQKALQRLPTDSVHLTFTSPPYYNARDYAYYETYTEYLNSVSSVLEQVHRVTKPGRFMVVNTSCVIEPREHRQAQSRRYAIPFDLHPRIMSMGWDFIDDIIWLKPEEAAKDRNSVFRRTAKPLTYKTNPTTEYLMVYRKSDVRLIDWNLRQYNETQHNDSRVDGLAPRGNVWQIKPSHDAVHPAVFPSELAERVIKLYSFKGDTVLDPYAGTGTTGAVSNRLSRRAVMCESMPEYVERIGSRVNRLDYQLFLVT